MPKNNEPALIIRDKPKKLTKQMVANSEYSIDFVLSNDTDADLYNYSFEYQGGKGFLKKIYNGNASDVSVDALFDDYKRTENIPALYNELVEAYINEKKQRDLRILDMIKALDERYRPEEKQLRPLNERQEVFDVEDLNLKLVGIQTPTNDGDFFIQPISVDGHFSNIIISNEKGKKKYYLYDSYIGNHRIDTKPQNTSNTPDTESIINTDIFTINIEPFSIPNLQKETNTCGFFCMSFALRAKEKANITELKESIDEREMQKAICSDVLELVGKNKLLRVSNQKEEDLMIKINSGQGFGRATTPLWQEKEKYQERQEEYVEQQQTILEQTHRQPNLEGLESLASCVSTENSQKNPISITPTGQIAKSPKSVQK